jgi:phospholipase C
MALDDASTSRLSRRRLLGAAAVGAGALGGLPALSLARARPEQPADPSAIQHIVVLMMENRSFDHFLGWLPGADGRQAGLQYADASGTLHQTYPLAPNWQGCGCRIPTTPTRAPASSTTTARATAGCS